MTTKPRKALIAGTFDPPTNGHMEVIRAAIDMFDEVVIAIGINPDKKPMFTVEERIDMLKECLTGHTNITVTSFEGKYQIRFAQEIGANYIVRGIRNAADFEYERTIRNINADMHGEIVQMVYIIPRRQSAEISSSMVKGLIGPQGWQGLVSYYVPHYVLQMIMHKVKEGEHGTAV